jgi:DNA-binding NtrC family response regulator
LIRPLVEVEKAAIESAMILCLGNSGEAAARLGISRTGLRAKLNQILAQNDEPIRDRRKKAMAAAA